ncbi:unnamed protein product, partial [Scytosiphon promiscuus]
VARVGISDDEGPAGGEVFSPVVEKAEARGVASGGGEVAAEGAVGRDGRGDSAELSVLSSLNLELSLTPECRRKHASTSRNTASVEPPARESTESCVSSLCLDLPFSCPPSSSSSSRESAAGLAPPSLRGAAGQGVNGATPKITSGRSSSSSAASRGTNGSNSAAGSDSPWSLRALSSAELSPLTPRPTPRSPRGPAVAGVPLARGGEDRGGGKGSDSTLLGCDGSSAAGDRRVRSGKENSLGSMPPAQAKTAVTSLDGGGGGVDGRDGGSCDRHRVGERPRTERAGVLGPPGKASSAADTITGVIVPPCRGAREGDRGLAGQRENAIEGGQDNVEETAMLAEEEDLDTEDGAPHAAASSAPAAASAGAISAAAQMSKSQGKGQRDSRHASSGAERGGHAESVVQPHGAVLMDDVGSGGGSGSAKSSPRAGDEEEVTQLRVKGAARAAVEPTVPASSVAAAMKAYAAVTALGPRGTGEGGSGERGNDSGDEEPFFTEGARQKGLTNWAAGVCGRRELLSYPGEATTSRRLSGERGMIDAATRAVGGDSGTVTERIGDGGPAAEKERREKRCAGGVVSGKAAGGGSVGHIPQEGGGGPGRRAGSQAQRPKRSASAAGAQQLVFTSEEESGGKLAPGDAPESLVSDPSPLKLLATPPPPPPASVSVATDGCRGRGSPAQDTELNTTASMCSGVLQADMSGGGRGPEAAAEAAAVAPEAQTVELGGDRENGDRAGHRGGRGERAEGGWSGGSATAAASLPASAADAADAPTDPESSLALSPDATQTPRDHGTGAAGTTAERAETKRGPLGRHPSVGKKADWALLTSRQGAPAGEGDSRGKSGLAPESPLVSGALEPLPAAALSSIAARQSVDDWFSSRRAGGTTVDSPLTPGSQASPGTGGTATQS